MEIAKLSTRKYIEIENQLFDVGAFVFASVCYSTVDYNEHGRNDKCQAESERKNGGQTIERRLAFQGLWNEW